MINLPYKEDRRERLEKHLAELGLVDPKRLEWVRAISGDWCPPPTYFQAGNGAWGCLQSHVRVVQDAIMDRVESVLVLEDDVIFHERALELLGRLMEEVPDDWGQIYLGGQHLHEPNPVLGSQFVVQCRNVNRTHAFALHRRAMVQYQQHICQASDYISHGPWHLDHQLGMAHEGGFWKAYAPVWWIAGQDAGGSNISGHVNPRLWWNFSGHSVGLPFIHLAADADPAVVARVRNFVHFGNNLKEGTFEDIGLDQCVGAPDRLREWLKMIAREAMDMQLVPGIQHPLIAAERVNECWQAGVRMAGEVDPAALVDYPFNGLFSHPLNEAEELAGESAQSTSSAA